MVPALWSSWLRAPRLPAPFRSVRRRLVAWNIGVLCAILLIVAASVYITQSRAVAGQVDAQLRSQAQRGLSTGHAAEDIVEAHAATPAASGTEDVAAEGSEPYEANDSPNLFSLLVDSAGHVARAAPDIQAVGLPDMAAAWPVLKGAQRSSLVTVERHTQKGDIHFRLYTVPVAQSGRIVGALQVGTSLTPRYVELGDFLLWLGIIGAIGVVLAAVGGLFLAERALVPVQAAYERQRVFVGDASHELRTPLSLIRAEAELLLHALERSRQRVAVGGVSDSLALAGDEPSASAEDNSEMARDLVSEVDYMSHLVDHLLQLARMESDAEPLQREIVALDAVARRTCRFAEALAAERGLDLTFHVGRSSSRGACFAEVDELDAHGLHVGAGADDHAESPTSIPPVRGDPERLRQLLLILLDNALRYTPSPGAVRVSCWHRADSKSRAHAGMVVVEVADTGPGIAPEHLPHLFDRFYRVDKARSRELGGSGLGLAIADGIAHAHDGTLTVHSEVGVGTCFQVELPAAPQR